VLASVLCKQVKHTIYSSDFFFHPSSSYLSDFLSVFGPFLFIGLLSKHQTPLHSRLSTLSHRPHLPWIPGVIDSSLSHFTCFIVVQWWVN